MNNNNSNATIVDVRTPEEFAGGHLENAINIPLDQVPQRIEEFKTMQKPVVTYCRSGTSSGMAVIVLKKNGIPDAINGGTINDVTELLKKLEC